MVSYSRRAVNPAQKAERRQVLLQAALDCFDRSTFEKLTMAEVARAAGVSKGTLYLYFQSKEEMFLEVLLELYRDWFQVFEKPPEGDLVDHLVDSLTARPKLLDMMSMSPAVLERAAPIAAVMAFKESLSESLLQLGETINIEPQRLMWIYAAVVGLYSTTHPPEEVREAVRQDPRLKHFDIDFSEELRLLLRQLI